MVLLDLFFSFMKIGFFSFGGMTMIPVINDEVLVHGWLTSGEVMEIKRQPGTGKGHERRQAGEHGHASGCGGDIKPEHLLGRGGGGKPGGDPVEPGVYRRSLRVSYV